MIYLGCSIACLCVAFSFPSARIQSLYVLLMRFPHSEMTTLTLAYKLPLDQPTNDQKPVILGSPHFESQLCYKIFPTQSPTKFLTLLLGFFPLRGQKLIVITDGIPPTLENSVARLPDHFHAKSNISELKISTPRGRNRF